MTIAKISAALVLGASALAAGFASTAVSSAAPACLATPIRTIPVPGDRYATSQVVKAGPFSGYIAAAYDVVKGRFRLHVGPYRDRASGLTQKIPWYVQPRDVPKGAAVGDTLTVSGTRLSPRPVRRFQERNAGGGLFPLGYVFPTNISPPAAGCWRLTFVSGTVRGSLRVLVRG